MESPTGVGFLLSQLGLFASGRFAERVAALELTPPQVGMLRVIALSPGLSQQTLAERLGILPSRMVALVDDLESRSLVERARNPQDRRLYALTLTQQGAKLLASIGEIAVEHERDICGPLSAREREQLTGLLRRIAEAHDLPLAVHLGFRNLGENC